MKRLSAHHPLQLLVGLTIWAVWFVVVYGGLSLACDLERPPGLDGTVWSWMNGVLLLVTLPVLAVLLWAAWACWRAARRLPAGDAGTERDRFVATTGAALYVVAAFSTAFVALPLLAVPACV